MDLLAARPVLQQRPRAQAAGAAELMTMTMMTMTMITWRSHHAMTSGHETTMTQMKHHEPTMKRGPEVLRRRTRNQERRMRRRNHDRRMKRMRRNQ
jgi:hypothetical protein